MVVFTLGIPQNKILALNVTKPRRVVTKEKDASFPRFESKSEKWVKMLRNTPEKFPSLTVVE